MEWNQQLLQGPAREAIQAMVFPALSKIGGSRGMPLIHAWSQAGNAVGNHTAAHRSFGSAQMTRPFAADCADADEISTKPIMPL